MKSKRYCANLSINSKAKQNTNAKKPFNWQIKRLLFEPNYEIAIIWLPQTVQFLWNAIFRPFFIVLKKDLSSVPVFETDKKFARINSIRIFVERVSGPALKLCFCVFFLTCFYCFTWLMPRHRRTQLESWRSRSPLPNRPEHWPTEGNRLQSAGLTRSALCPGRPKSCNPSGRSGLKHHS